MSAKYLCPCGLNFSLEDWSVHREACPDWKNNVEGIRKGLADRKTGRFVLWEDVKRDLGIEGEP